MSCGPLSYFGTLAAIVLVYLIDLTAVASPVSLHLAGRCRGVVPIGSASE